MIYILCVIFMYVSSICSVVKSLIKLVSMFLRFIKLKEMNDNQAAGIMVRYTFQQKNIIISFLLFIFLIVISGYCCYIMYDSYLSILMILFVSYIVAGVCNILMLLMSKLIGYDGYLSFDGIIFILGNLKKEKYKFKIESDIENGSKVINVFKKETDVPMRFQITENENEVISIVKGFQQDMV